MELLDEKRLKEKVMKKYDDQPLGWKYFYGKDKEGNHNMVITNKILGEQYWLKFNSPYGEDKICVGVRAGIEDEELSSFKDSFFGTDFGMRPVKMTKDEFLEFISGKSRTPNQDSNALKEALKSSPVSRDELKDEVTIMKGVYQRLEPTDIASISPAQLELDIKMKEELQRLKKIHLRYIA